MATPLQGRKALNELLGRRVYLREILERLEENGIETSIPTLSRIKTGKRECDSAMAGELVKMAAKKTAIGGV